MSKRRSRKHRRREAEDLNITAFMNLMVVLTPFLLITAVFSRLAVLELNLPAAQSEVNEVEPEFQLEITVRDSGIEVGDRTAGLLNRIEKTGENYHLDQLSTYLARIKRRFPDKADATLLLEPDISYQVLVAVMDKVRVAENFDSRTNRVVRSELFPEVSIGDAPVLN
ncbi:MAG TPA: biopolymer transporter ExbD [Gammaproteobacteria bacterium]|nr:biopolymer transporter ExbD [Gammaproteobacteria bacterium]